MKFVHATKTKLKGRIGIMGPSGSGKTWTALLFARAMGKRIAVIDTENRSASKYADTFDFDVMDLTDFAPRTYVMAIHAAEEAGYDVIIVDGISPAWAGKGGVLEIVDQAAARSRSKNTYAAWREGTPEHNALVESLVGCKTHLIVTMRSKVEYVLEDDERGRKVPRKIGMAPIQREGLEYEFDLVGDMDYENRFVVTKSRCPSLSGKVWTKPGPEVAQQFLAWLDAGVEAPQIVGTAAESVPPGTEARAQSPSPSSNGTPEKLSECLTAEQVTAWVVRNAELLANMKGEKLTKAHATVTEAAKRVGIDPVALWNLESGHVFSAAQMAMLASYEKRWAEFTHPIALNNWWKKHEEEVAAEGPEFYDAVTERSVKRQAELAGNG